MTEAQTSPYAVTFISIHSRRNELQTANWSDKWDSVCQIRIHKGSIERGNLTIRRNLSMRAGLDNKTWWNFNPRTWPTEPVEKYDRTSFGRATLTSSSARYPTIRRHLPAGEDLIYQTPLKVTKWLTYYLTRVKSGTSLSTTVSTRRNR